MPENEAKNGLFERLRKIGIYAKTAWFLLDNFPLERIEKCLELYPLAVKAGRADGPGWVVKAVSDPVWDLDIEVADLQERVETLNRHEQSSQTVQTPRRSPLPKNVLEALREIGWNGGMEELQGYYRNERKAFKAWLDWAQTQPREYAAARFLTGLRSGMLPPVSKKQTDDRRRYLEGPYADIIEH